MIAGSSFSGWLRAPPLSWLAGLGNSTTPGNHSQSNVLKLRAASLLEMGLERRVRIHKFLSQLSQGRGHTSRCVGAFDTGTRCYYL